MLKTEKRVIDGLEITTTQLPALRSLGLFNKLGKVLAPALSSIPDTFSFEHTEVASLAPAFVTIFGAMEAGEAQALACNILESTNVELDGKVISLTDPRMVDLVFSGRLPTMFKAIAFVLEVNFSDFFKGALGQENQPAPEAKAESKSISNRKR
jgi:hypothetical protein